VKADREAIKRLLRTARGQVDGIVRMVEEDKYCLDISNQIMACEAVLKKANKEILRAHMENCVRQSLKSDSGEDADRKIQEIVDLLGKM